MLVIFMEGLISRQDIVLPVGQLACVSHVHPAYFLVTQITILQGCDIQTGSDCIIGEVVRVVGAVLLEHGDSTIAMKKGILSFVFITKN